MRSERGWGVLGLSCALNPLSRGPWGAGLRGFFPILMLVVAALAWSGWCLLSSGCRVSLPGIMAGNEGMA